MNKLHFLAISLITLILLPTNANAHCGGKHSGNHPHCANGGGDGDSGEYSGSNGVQFISPSDVAGFDYHIIGTSGADNITAGSGADLIEGGADRDEIQALGGDDVIRGDDGDDRVDAGEGDDFVYGDAGNDFLNGGPGNDWLEGGDGNDELYFSLGASFGGAVYGADHIDGGQGFDALSFGDYAGPGGYQQINHVSVDLASNTYEVEITDSSGAIAIVQGDFLSIEDLWATRGNDTLIGSSVDERMYGAEGDDVLHGLGGNDSLNGGQGNDEVFGGPGNDEVGGEPGADLVVGGDGDDIVSGAESGVGNLTDDVLWGGNEDDLVATGADTFHFRREFGTDTVMDYQQDEIIHLNGYIGGFWRNDMSFDVININNVGNDIVVDFWLKRGGGTGGTIILKGATARGIVVDESDFIID